MNKVKTKVQALKLWCPHINQRCKWEGCMAWEATEATDAEVTLTADNGTTFTDYQLGIMEGMMQEDVYFSYINKANSLMPTAAAEHGQEATKNMWRESVIAEFLKYNAKVPMHKDYNLTGFCTLM